MEKRIQFTRQKKRFMVLRFEKRECVDWDEFKSMSKEEEILVNEDSQWKD